MTAQVKSKPNRQGTRRVYMARLVTPEGGPGGFVRVTRKTYESLIRNGAEVVE